VSPPISNYVYQIPDQGSYYGGTCEDCHNGHNIVEEAGDTAQTPPQKCGECHGGFDRRFSDFSEIKEHHYNHCSTCHESTDQTVVDVIAKDKAPFNYNGVADHINCIECHNTVGDHVGHPLTKAGIRGSIYADDAAGQQTLTCFTDGCHASNTVTEHLSPRGIGYKNYSFRYGQAFTCELCHENKYSMEEIKRGTCSNSTYDNNAKECVENGHTWSGGKICSDPEYITEASCLAGEPRWMQTTAECSDPKYTTEQACNDALPGDLTWDDLVINSDPIINTAILNGIAGNYVYCSDCHQESITRFDRGECEEDPARENEIECINKCSILPETYTTQVDCLLNGGEWNVPTGYTWTDAGYCNDIRFSTKVECEITGPAGEPVWYTATQACSDPQYTTEQACNDATSTPDWYEIMPYSIHDKYNGVGIYSFYEKHHEALIWDGTCSNPSYTVEQDCYDNSGVWTPTSTPGKTYVGTGDCIVCHKDPRKAPYDRSVCEDTSYAADNAGCITAGLAVYGGTCSDTQYKNTYDCTDNGGTWSGGTCLDYSKDQDSCIDVNDSWIAHPAGATKALPAPKQLPCVTCHSDVDATDKELTIYKEKTSVQVDPLGTYGGWTHTPTGPIANTVLRGCSNDDYTDEPSCTPVADHSWYEPLGVCLDETYEDRTSCEAAVGNYHWETPCSDNQYDNAATCRGYCSHTEHTTESACTTGGGSWEGGICLADQYHTESTCTTGGETWTGSVNFDTWEGTEHKWNVNGYCSDTQYLTESDCTTNSGTWYGGNIQSYGACIFCHKMRPYHAYPGPPADDSDFANEDLDITDDGLVDPPHFPIASRGVLNVFYGTHRKPYIYYKGTGQQGNKGSYQDIRDADALPDDSVTWWADVIYDPQADPTGMVPTVGYCSDRSLATKTACESAVPKQWWRPGHRLGEPEYFSIPTFDIPIGTAVDTITIDTSNGGSEYDEGAQTILVVAEIDAASTGVIYALWAGVKKPMTIDSSQGGTNTWTVTFTAADGVSDQGDQAIGRVYVISVDESGDNHDLLHQATWDPHVR